jgi:hypothetical protein
MRPANSGETLRPSLVVTSPIIASFGFGSNLNSSSASHSGSSSASVRVRLNPARWGILLMNGKRLVA